MSYCIAISLNEGMLFCSDSRCSQPDNTYTTQSKLFRFEQAPDRKFVILTAGNLNTGRATMDQLSRDISGMAQTSLNTVNTIAEAADYVGDVYREQLLGFETITPDLESTFLLGGQIQGSRHRVVKIYAAGNNITSSRDTPFLQIGESKYGTPILERIITRDTSLDTAALCSLVSMCSTMNSDQSVGPPIELMLYQTNSFQLANYHFFDENSEFLLNLNKRWAEKLLDAFHQMPPLAWASSWEKISDSSSGIY